MITFDLSSSQGAWVGVSTVDEGNLAQHVGDNVDKVMLRRQQLALHTKTQAKHWLWLQQTHSNHVACISTAPSSVIEADAVVTTTPGLVPVVMTADCVPIVLFCAKTHMAAAIHAGWSGLYQEIIAKTLACFSDASSVTAWIGPHIRQASYEVDADFQARFLTLGAQYEKYFASKEGSIYASLLGITKQQLHALGVRSIMDSRHCTYKDKRFYSHRRQGVQAGRIASFIIIPEDSET